MARECAATQADADTLFPDRRNHLAKRESFAGLAAYLSFDCPHRVDDDFKGKNRSPPRRARNAQGASRMPVSRTRSPITPRRPADSLSGDHHRRPTRLCRRKPIPPSIAAARWRQEGRSGYRLPAHGREGPAAGISPHSGRRGDGARRLRHPRNAGSRIIGRERVPDLFAGACF